LSLKNEAVAVFREDEGGAVLEENEEDLIFQGDEEGGDLGGSRTYKQWLTST